MIDKKEKNRERENREEFDRIFEKYHFDYNDEPRISEKTIEIKRQRYIFDKLNEIGLENTAIEKLLDMTLEDIERQHTIKAGIESKAGFILALWGILLTALLGGENSLLEIIKTNLLISHENFVLTIVAIIIVGIPCITSLCFICATIKPHEYKKFMFDEKEYNFKGAVDSKNIAYTTMLDMVTNSWINNRETINLISKKYEKAMLWVVVFAIALVTSKFLLI